MCSLLRISETVHNRYFLIFQTLKQLTFPDVRWMGPNYSPLYFSYKISASLHNNSRNYLRKHIHLISEMLRKFGRAKFKHMRTKINGCNKFCSIFDIMELSNWLHVTKKKKNLKIFAKSKSSTIV